MDDRLAAGLPSGGQRYGPATSASRTSRARRSRILYQNDDYGKECLYGFQKTVGAGRDRRLAELPARRRAPRPPTPRRRACAPLAPTRSWSSPRRREAIVALVVAYTTRLAAADKLVNSVGATDSYHDAAQNSAGSPDAVNGVVSTGVPEIPVRDPSYANDPQIKLYKQIMAKYAPSFPSPGTTRCSSTGWPRPTRSSRRCTARARTRRASRS